MANLTKYNEIPDLPKGYGDLAPGVFLRMTAAGTLEQSSKPPSPRVILNEFEYDELKEVLEFNLRYCDGDKSGWPPLLDSGVLDFPKACKLMGTAARLGTYTLHEASKKYVASSSYGRPETRNMLRAAILAVPPIIEENFDPGALKMTGLTLGELKDVLKKEKILPGDLKVDQMSKAQLIDSLRRLSTLNVGDMYRETTKEEMFIGMENFRKAQAASRDDGDDKKRTEARDESEVARKVILGKKFVAGKNADAEQGPKDKTSNSKTVQTSQVADQAVSTKDDEEADSTTDPDVYSDIYADGDSAADSDSSSDSYIRERRGEDQLAEDLVHDYPFIVLLIAVLYMTVMAILVLDLKTIVGLELN